MSQAPVFDQKHYELLNQARGDVVRPLVEELKTPLRLSTAIDIACGLGHFSRLLRSLGLEVTAVDGRQQNVDEAQRRNPDIRFLRFDAEDTAMRSLGKFDLVFCFGLLYHLENPFLAIRHLHAMTRSLLLVEGLIYLGDEPMMAFVDESGWEDQGLRNYAFYPTEACLVKMMYRAGFENVFRFATMPNYPEYHDSAGDRRIRTILAASTVPLDSAQLVPFPEPPSVGGPLAQRHDMGAIARLRRFVAKPFSQKVDTVVRRVKGK